MTDCDGKISAAVLMLRPAGMPVGWERTDLWDSAASIPGVLVTGDEEGVIKYDTGSLLLTTHHAFGSMTPDMKIIAPASDDPDEQPQQRGNHPGQRHRRQEVPPVAAGQHRGRELHDARGAEDLVRVVAAVLDLVDAGVGGPPSCSIRPS